MKTPMQELIERLNNVKPTEFCSIETIKGWAESLIEKEKEQIMDAFEQGENNSVDYFVPDNNIKESEQYYNETFSK